MSDGGLKPGTAVDGNRGSADRGFGEPYPVPSVSPFDRFPARKTCRSLRGGSALPGCMTGSATDDGYQKRCPFAVDAQPVSSTGTAPRPARRAEPVTFVR